MPERKSIRSFLRRYRVGASTIIGAVTGIIYTCLVYSLHLTMVHGFLLTLVLGIVTALLMAYSTTSFEFLVIVPRFRTLSPFIILLIRIVTYAAIGLFWIGLVYILIYIAQEKTTLSGALRLYYEDYNAHVVTIGTVVMIIIAVFIFQITQLQSRNALVHFLLGSYAVPQKRKKIFMFLDLKSSTSHAELLGDLKFSNLLQDCFWDISMPVSETNGDVYQYIGDEVVLVWDYRNELRNFDCIRCFFKFREALRNKTDYYLEKYGFVPEFKAGLHGGDAVVVRIGEIKKEIAYHGDVLNTTARLQSLCNEFKTSLIISGDLLNDIEMNGHIIFEQIPSIPLKGKAHSIEIFRLKE